MRSHLILHTGPLSLKVQEITEDPEDAMNVYTEFQDMDGDKDEIAQSRCLLTDRLKSLEQCC